MAGAPSLFLHDFTVLDCAIASRTKGLQGSSHLVSAELFGALDAKDFLFDFSQAKKTLKALVDETVDHKLLVPSALVDRHADGLRWTASDGSAWDYDCPAAACEYLAATEITEAAIETHLAELALERMPENVSAVKFTLRSPERFLKDATFRYTHGLRYHDGNCQRLFHGHRNPVEVWVGAARSPEWEAVLAAEWEGAHFVAAPTLLNRNELDLPLGRRQPDLEGVAVVDYSSSQGSFRARIPASRVVLTAAEPSIETMSVLAFERLRAHGLRGAVRVLAYEGINKGAAFSETIL